MIKFDVHGSHLGGAAGCPTGDGRMPRDVSLFQSVRRSLSRACIAPLLCLTCDMIDDRGGDVTGKISQCEEQER
jgi:hypothetical protein